MSVERVLSTRELNRALLARQLLLERARLDVAGALERVGGLQAQYAPATYIGLWSRVEGFTRPDLTQALEARDVVQGTLMRVTIHAVAARDYWPLALAVRSARRAWWLRIHREHREDEVVAAAAVVREHLAAGPARWSELEALVGRSQASGVGLWVDLVRVPPSGTWERRRADLYALADHWLAPPDLTPDDATEHLVCRQLAAFGPSTRAEIAGWAGLAGRDLAPALSRMELRRFRAEDGQELLDLPGAPRPDADTPAPVRFLPVWDTMLLVHYRRKAVLAEEHRPLVFNNRRPHSVQTFLVDGVVAGIWTQESGRIEIEPFAPLRRGDARAAREEADRLAALYR
jgi:hypothetical protein